MTDLVEGTTPKVRQHDFGPRCLSHYCSSDFHISDPSPSLFPLSLEKQQTQATEQTLLSSSLRVPLFCHHISAELETE